MFINVTKEAKDVIAQQNPDGKNVRVYVSSVTWGGPKFAISLDEIKDTDLVQEVEGIKFIVDKGLDGQYEGVEVDYRQNTFSKGFAITLQGSRGGGCGH